MCGRCGKLDIERGQQILGGRTAGQGVRSLDAGEKGSSPPFLRCSWSTSLGVTGAATSRLRKSGVGAQRIHIMLTTVICR